VDAEDGDVYGVLFASSASLNQAYIIPFADILEDILRVTKALIITLPTSHGLSQTPLPVRQGTYWEDSFSPSPARIDLPNDPVRSLFCENNQLLRDSHSPEGIVGGKTWSAGSESSGFGKIPTLTRWDVFSLIVNKMIGTGIFSTPPIVYSLVGHKVTALTVWIVGFAYTCIRFVYYLLDNKSFINLTTSCSLFIYLEYDAKLPHTGGELVYVSRFMLPHHP
jgi:hypothetical protein